MTLLQQPRWPEIHQAIQLNALHFQVKDFHLKSFRLYNLLESNVIVDSELQSLKSDTLEPKVWAALNF